jgi:hypothetical protein
MDFMGYWFWWILAALLLIGEMLMPGFFLLWVAAAAALAGLAAFAFTPGWQVEIIVFCVAAAGLVAASWRLVMRQRQTTTDQPHLNRRVDGYVGRLFVLQQPTVNGSGKLRIDDTLWDVDGPDLPAGAKVKVTGVNGLRLTIEHVH